ncbi:MAG: SDR family NAD(P)-dependent oxidoreductase [Candidatus Azobacteroides sp.]|nr:SDR family NAD(P)-dependent oxidoreductase [Candidatus Azobacteroides sp.]
MNGNTVLITGGATGIGYSMAKYFYERGNTLIICGRRENRLAQAEKELQGIHTFPCDVANPDDRRALLKYMNENFSMMNILINNAGIQRDIDLTKGLDELDSGDSEIRINLEAPVYLSALFTSLLSGKENATIVHVSSGLAFMVEHAARAPLYCATKAGLHAFSIAQRIQLRPLGIRVVEIIPPMVESELNPEGRRKRNMLKSPYMMTSDDFVGKAFAKMEQDIDEIRLERP